MTPEEFLEYLQDTINGQIAGTGDILINHDECSFIYVDVEEQAFWKVSISRADVK